MSKVTFAMMAAGTVFSAYGAYQQAKVQRDMNAYNAAIANNNKILADQKLQLDLREQKLRFRKLRGKQNVAYAKSGVAIDMGSTLDVAEETGILNEWEMLKMKYNTDVVKAGYTGQVNKSNYMAKAMYRHGMIKAGTTLLTQGGETWGYGKEHEII